MPSLPRITILGLAALLSLTACGGDDHGDSNYQQVDMEGGAGTATGTEGADYMDASTGAVGTKESTGSPSQPHGRETGDTVYRADPGDTTSR